MRALILLIPLLLLLSCQSTNNKQDLTDADDHISSYSYNKGYAQFEEGVTESAYVYENGIYCAEVEYYNPNTGTHSSYTLNVEIEDDELVTIHWPNGGWLDESHFIAENISGGSCSFTSDKGYEYEVTIIGKGCSFTDSQIDNEKTYQDDDEQSEEELMEEDDNIDY